MQPTTIKPGWQTTEFWLSLGTIAAAVGVQMGFINGADVTKFTDGWSQTVTAAFTLVAQLYMAISYLKSRQALKVAVVNGPAAVAAASIPSPGMVKPQTLGMMVAVLIVGFMCVSPAFAQFPARPPNITVQRSIPAAFLPWRDAVEKNLRSGQQQPAPQQQLAPQTDPALIAALMQRQAPASDPAVVTALTQIVALNQQMITLMQQHNNCPTPPPATPIVIQAPPTPAPVVPPTAQTPPPQTITYHLYMSPSPQGALQTFPIQGQPLQSFPIQGQPLQVYPIQGAPLQQLPIQGQPLQQLPIQGQPIQVLPIQPVVPVQPLPIAPVQPVTPAQPNQQKAPIIVPQTFPIQPMPPATGTSQPPPPVGFQRFTHAVARPVN